MILEFIRLSDQNISSSVILSNISEEDAIKCILHICVEVKLNHDHRTLFDKKHLCAALYVIFLRTVRSFHTSILPAIIYKPSCNFVSVF